MMWMLRFSGFHISNHNFPAQLMSSARLLDKLPRSTISSLGTTLQNTRSLKNSWLNANTWLAPNIILKWSAVLLKIYAIKQLPNPELTLLDTSSNFTKENFKELLMLMKRIFPVSTLILLVHSLDSKMLVILPSENLTLLKLTNMLHAI